MNPRPSGSMLFMTALLLAAAIAMHDPVSAKSSSKTTTNTPSNSISTWSDDRDRHFSFILAEDDGEKLSGFGNIADYSEAERLGRERKQDLILAYLEGRTYLILDKGMVERACKASEPVRAIGGQQAKLGQQQAAIGGKQAQIGGQQALIGERQRELGNREGRLHEQIASRQEEGEATKDLLRQLEEVRQEAAKLSDQQEELSRQQQELSRQQRPLSEQQRALGAQNRTLSDKMNDDVEAMVREAVKSGLAERQD